MLKHPYNVLDVKNVLKNISNIIIFVIKYTKIYYIYNINILTLQNNISKLI